MVAASGSSSASSLAGPGGQRGQLDPHPLGLVGGDAGVAAGAGEDREARRRRVGPWRAARPGPGRAPAARAGRGPRRRRPPRPARGRPAGRRRPRRCAPPRPRAPACGGADLQHRDADAALGADARAPRPAWRRRRPPRGRARPSARPSRSATAASQSLASSTAWLPVETTVWKSMPRREPIALTARFPLCEIIATGAGLERPAPSRPRAARGPRPRSPRCRSARRAASRPRAATSAQLALESPPAGGLAEPGGDRRSRRRSRARPPRRATPGTSAAGIATTTASTGSGRSAGDGHADRRPCTLVRVGWTPQTGPVEARPGRRLRRTVSP